MTTPRNAAQATRRVKRLMTGAGLSPAWVRTRHLLSSDRSHYVWCSALCFAGSDEAEQAAQVLSREGYQLVGNRTSGLVSASISAEPAAAVSPSAASAQPR